MTVVLLGDLDLLRYVVETDIPEAIARELSDRPVLFYGTDRQLLAISRHRDERLGTGGS